MRHISNSFKHARPLYCSVDPDLYFSEPDAVQHFDLGYLGTYSDDRQPTVNRLLVEPARNFPEKRFIVAGPQYPDDIEWPGNVKRSLHISPQHHRNFYNSQRFTLNVTRRDMIQAGFSPSVRLFEAAACGTPIISDDWTGLDHFFILGEELLAARNSKDVEQYLNMTEQERINIGIRGRKRVLNAHTSTHRAAELEGYWREVADPSSVITSTQ